MFRILFIINAFLGGVFCYGSSEKKLLIVSCGGGGTVYISKCLQAGGLNIGHEHIHEDGVVGWPFVQGICDHNGYAIPGEGTVFTHTFHQVRHPLFVIATWLKNKNMNTGFWQFIRHFVPEIRETERPIVQCAKYWYYWNKKAEAMSEWTYRVEDFQGVVGEFESRLGIVLDKEAMWNIPKNVGSWQGQSCQITWELLQNRLPENLYRNIQEMAQRYGYSTID